MCCLAFFEIYLLKLIFITFTYSRFTSKYHPFNIMAVIRKESLQLSFFDIETAKIGIRH